MRYLFAVLFFGCCQVSQATSAELPESVRDALKRANIPLSSVGIVVHKTDARTPLLSQNAKLAMNPASTMKLLTTFAALETLGPAYRWKTEVYLDGKLENGVLQGNLVFKGYGDPKLNIEQFWLWLRELRQRGLREIRGDIVLDCSFFDGGIHDPAEFDNDPTRAYNVGPNALLLNFNALHLRLIPNAAQTDVLLEPDLSGYAIKNRIKTAAKQPCKGGDTYSARLEERSIVLEGTIPADCGEVEEYFSLLPHGDYFFAVFSALWQELGGTLQGKMRVGSVPENQVAFSTHRSPPLSEVIRDINKFSNNTMARQLFLTLGTTTSANAAANSSLAPVFQSMSPLPRADTPLSDTAMPGNQISDNTEAEPAQPDAGLAASADAKPLRCDPSANIARSAAVVRQWLSTQQLQFPELVLENGSGLSRAERISPQSLADLLQRAAHSPFYAELAASLPILGMDGTMKKRFKDNEIAGYAHLKTGMLEGVKSLAGYVQTHSGEQLIVVFIINHPNAKHGQAAQDALIEWLQKRH
ncbi:MAG TPA: D-alanyl-D-alanine carboxypeptidase/D-alanyl-D-alanine-endopeptidase [Gallionella sp.]|nr:D-alanyl-D-alanine carboxypeptidase/D-alanyl-D-alanine-endopeptidase [Gallionella sp.]